MTIRAEEMKTMKKRTIVVVDDDQSILDDPVGLSHVRLVTMCSPQTMFRLA